MSIITEQLQWIRSGKIGCVFATVLSYQHNKIGWSFMINNGESLSIPTNCNILSIIFPNKTIIEVKEWALQNGFYIDSINEMYEGLRIKLPDGISWVQYFGPDSHVTTRQSPYPMLSFTIKLPKKYYYKVGFEKVLHLAHASVEFLKDTIADIYWDRSFILTEKRLGYKPTLKEAAKTTFIKL